MQFIFVDEAGTSANEPVTIVAALIIDADKQLLRVESGIREVLGAVPSQIAPGFIFSSKDSWSGNVKNFWGTNDRLEIILNMMRLVQRFRLPVAFGVVRRDWVVSNIPTDNATQAKFHHLMAFQLCIAKADQWIRDHTDIDQVGSVVAEDVPEMRKWLKHIPRMLREKPFYTPKGGLRPTAEEEELGYLKQKSDLRVTRIRQGIHFAEKPDDPVLQLVDACAFGLRAYFSDQDFGDRFVQEILGMKPSKKDFSDQTSGGLYFF